MDKLKVFKLQKRCARIILDAQQPHSTVDLFNTLTWVPFNIESVNGLQGNNWYLPCLYKRAIRTKQQPAQQKYTRC